MSLEVQSSYHSVSTDLQHPATVEPRRGSADTAANRGSAAPSGANTPTHGSAPVDIKAVVAELEQVTNAVNRRLKFSVNDDLNQIIVKVIDGETDKVIKELPPEEIQRLHERIREAIGLLVDERM